MWYIHQDCTEMPPSLCSSSGWRGHAVYWWNSAQYQHNHLRPSASTGTTNLASLVIILTCCLLYWMLCSICQLICLRVNLMCDINLLVNLPVLHAALYKHVICVNNEITKGYVFVCCQWLQVHTFYEALGCMISAQTETQQQERLIENYMSLPNQVWDGIILQATQVSILCPYVPCVFSFTRV